jgi:hypothetical protein
LTRLPYIRGTAGGMPGKNKVSPTEPKVGRCFLGREPFPPARQLHKQHQGDGLHLTGIHIAYIARHLDRSGQRHGVEEADGVDEALRLLFCEPRQVGIAIEIGKPCLHEIAQGHGSHGWALLHGTAP